MRAVVKVAQCRMFVVSPSDVIEIVEFQLFYPTALSLVLITLFGMW